MNRLRGMIVEGRIAAGERLHEINFAETLDVSRTLLRESLKLLANEGLVELLPGRGARVSVPTPAGVASMTSPSETGSARCRPSCCSTRG